MFREGLIVTQEFTSLIREILGVKIDSGEALTETTNKLKCGLTPPAHHSNHSKPPIRAQLLTRLELTM
jgi:hypothetical protein